MWVQTLAAPTLDGDGPLWEPKMPVKTMKIDKYIWMGVSQTLKTKLKFLFDYVMYNVHFWSWNVCAHPTVKVCIKKLPRRTLLTFYTTQKHTINIFLHEDFFVSLCSRRNYKRYNLIDFLWNCPEINPLPSFDFWSFLYITRNCFCFFAQFTLETWNQLSLNQFKVKGKI